MDEEQAAELRSKFLAVDGLKIVAEIDEPALFDSALRQFPAELVVINLDADPESLIGFGTQIAEKYPDLTLFAVSSSENAQLILQAVRGGFREFLIHPIDDKQLDDAINRIAKMPGNQAETGRLICVLGSVGGCGATTIATNLACELAQVATRSVVLVDLDLFFGHVATCLDLSPQFSLADLCQTLDSVDPGMVEKALVKHETGLNVLARPQHFAQAQQVSLANVAAVLNALCGMFEYVVCDGPVRTDTIKPGLLDLADATFVIMNLTVPSVRNIDRILQEFTREGYNLDRIQLVASRFSSDHNGLSVDDVEQTLNRKILWTVPEDPKTVAAAVNTGQPLVKCAPKSKAREAIKAMAMKLHNPQAAPDSEKNSGGLLSRMLGR